MILKYGWLAFVAVASVLAQTAERPLGSLPYTPSLDAQFMDKSADPCMNFYQYACGNWNKLNPMPADQAHWSVYAKVADDNERFLWGLLDKYAQAANRTPYEQKIGDYFHACMDTAAIEEASAKPLDKALKQIADLKSAHDIAAYAGGHAREGMTSCLDSAPRPTWTTQRW